MNDFKKEYSSIQSRLIKKIDQNLKQGWYILGDEGEKFEKNFAAYCGTKYSIGVANGLEALQIALMALDIGKGDEVITVANSAVATSLAITAVGATPVFADIDEYFHMDANQLQQLITPKTKAILPVHLYGQICEIEKICKIAKEHNIYVIEDACQAHGATHDGREAGSFGTFGCFSFYPTKNLGAYGDGGAITTNSKVLFEKCKKIRNYGQSVRYYHDLKGINSRLDEIQAVILNFKLPTLDQKIKKRIMLADSYFSLLSDIPQLTLPKIRKNSRHSFHLFVIECERRGELIKYLKKSEVESFIHYPVPIHKQECYREFNRLILPMTEEKAKKVLSLPISPELTFREIKKVCKKIIEFYES